jgi:uracil-DNA glycosylase family 4
MVKPRGKLDAPIVIVGDAPTDREMEEGLSFSGHSYDLMYDLLGQAGFDIEDCVFVNAVTFQKYTKRGALTEKEILPDAKKYLIPFIAQYPRKMVIAMGNNALCATGVSKKPQKVNSFRSKVSVSELLEKHGCTAFITATLHPWLVLKEPDLDKDLVTDLSYARRIYLGEHSEQVGMEIRDIDKPQDVKHLWNAISKNSSLAYDFETSSLDRDNALVVTSSFCNGLKNSNGEYIVWFWGGYDKLQPRYPDTLLKQFVREFDSLFMEAGNLYDLIAWNMAYDDWVAERWVGHELPGSQFDGMIMKWSVDNRRPHDLKSSTARFLGYPNYDKAVDESVKAIAARRNKILTSTDDLFVLEYFGYTPEKAKTGYRWPKKLDKKLAAYAMQEFEELRLYNCYDAVYTYLLFEKLGDRINRANLGFSCDFRHRVAREFYRAEQRGMLCDVKLNREFSKTLADLEKKCKIEISNQVASMGFDLPDFNYLSGDQLGEILYGKPVMLPFIDRTPLYRKHVRSEIDQRCNDVEASLYGDVEDVEEVRKAVEVGHGVDTEKLQTILIQTYKQRYGDDITTYGEPYYLQGMYKPIGYTKTGKPSTAGAILQTLYHEYENPFLALVLMARRANKLKSTFIDGIYEKLDASNVLRPRYNVIGTETGRASSSNPNGQNFTKYVRGQLIARPGYQFLEFDLSQAEIRGIAAESGDLLLIEALDASDIHTRIASIVFKLPEADVNPDTHRRYAKAQPLTARIATPFGWTTMGRLKIGDYVVSSDGKPCRVTDIFPQGLREVYEVLFDDGQVIECSGDHLWTVIDRSSRVPTCRLMATIDMFSHTSKGRGYRFAVERTKPVEFAPQTEPLFISPYTMGVLLGDGSIQHSMFTVIDQEIVRRVEEDASNYGWKLERYKYEKRIPCYRLKNALNYKRSIYAEFKRIDSCIRWISNDKYIPRRYMLGTVDERWALLQGLMDTDGTASKSSNFSYCSVSQRLVEDVAELVRSLGGRARILRSENRNGRVYYRVAVMVSKCPFYLKRKAIRWRPSRTTCTSIREINRSDRFVDMQCIMVDHPSHLYLTEGYIPTHNTIVFGIIYGMSAYSLALALKVTQSDAEKFIEDFFKAFPGMKSWLDNQVKLAHESPYYVYTPWGTRRSTLNVLSVDRQVVSHTERTAMNMPIQGGAGELCFWDICQVMDEVRRQQLEVWFLNNTHDSGLFEIEESLGWYENGKVCGPVAEIVNSVISTPPPVFPLNRVKWKADLSLSRCWSATPNLNRALDPKFGTNDSIFRWDLIRTDLLDYDEQEELNEVIEVMSQ